MPQRRSGGNHHNFPGKKIVTYHSHSKENEELFHTGFDQTTKSHEDVDNHSLKTTGSHIDVLHHLESNDDINRTLSTTNNLHPIENYIMYSNDTPRNLQLPESQKSSNTIQSNFMLNKLLDDSSQCPIYLQDNYSRTRIETKSDSRFSQTRNEKNSGDFQVAGHSRSETLGLYLDSPIRNTEMIRKPIKSDQGYYFEQNFAERFCTNVVKHTNDLDMQSNYQKYTESISNITPNHKFITMQSKGNLKHTSDVPIDSTDINILPTTMTSQRKNIKQYPSHSFNIGYGEVHEGRVKIVDVDQKKGTKYSQEMLNEFHTEDSNISFIDNNYLKDSFIAEYDPNPLEIHTILSSQDLVPLPKSSMQAYLPNQTDHLSNNALENSIDMNPLSVSDLHSMDLDELNRNNKSPHEAWDWSSGALKRETDDTSKEGPREEMVAPIQVDSLVEQVSCLKCQICSFLTQTRKEMQKHISSEHTNKRLPKHYINEHQKSSIHKLKHTSENALPTSHTNLQSYPKVKMENEETLHNTRQRIEVKSEEISNNLPQDANERLLDDHINEKNNPNSEISIKDKIKYSCDVSKKCTLELDKKQDMEYHKKCHNNGTFSCPECSHPPVSRWAILTAHLWRAHCIDIGLHKCPQCSYRCYNKKFLFDIHFKSHSDVRSFQCSDCERSFKTKKQLTYHVNVTHKNPKSKKTFTCHICQRILKDAKKLQAHISAVHEKLKPFLCSFCGKAFSKNAALTTHVRTHTGEKPFLCDLCPYKSGDHNTFRRHKMKHSNSTNYSCPYCKYSTIQVTTYHSHLVKKHKEIAIRENVLFICPHCSYQTIKKSTFNTHLSQHNHLILENHKQVTNEPQTVMPTTSASTDPNNAIQILSHVTPIYILGDQPYTVLQDSFIPTQ